MLSAFGSVEVYDTEWALLSEINEAEVREPIRTLTNFILMITLVMIVIAVAAAVFFSRTISKPILLIVAGAKNLAVGDTGLCDVNKEEFERIKNRPDELGVIGTSFSGLIEYQAEKASIAKEIANKNLRVEARISSEKDTLGKSFREMVDSLNELLSQVNNAVAQVNNGADQVSQASQNLSQGPPSRPAVWKKLPLRPTRSTASRSRTPKMQLRRFQSPSRPPVMPRTVTGRCSRCLRSWCVSMPPQTR